MYEFYLYEKSLYEIVFCTRLFFPKWLIYVTPGNLGKQRRRRLTINISLVQIQIHKYSDLNSLYALRAQSLFSFTNRTMWKKKGCVHPKSSRRASKRFDPSISVTEYRVAHLKCDSKGLKRRFAEWKGLKIVLKTPGFFSMKNNGKWCCACSYFC